MTEEYSARNTLPAFRLVKGSARDLALLRRHPDRARRVRGWLYWPLDRAEIAGIRRYLETGEDVDVPGAFPPV